MKLKSFKKPILGILSAAIIFSSPLTSFAKDDGSGKSEVNIQAESAVVFDMNLGEVVYQVNPDKQYPTASLAKVMTMYLASEAKANGEVKDDDLVDISAKAWKTYGSRMFLEVGRQVPYGDIMKGIAIVSGNDASVAMAEHLEGSTDNFVKKMNEKAVALGMENTKFETVNGLPKDGSLDLSTANDLAKLSVDYINKYESNLGIHSTKTFAFDTGRGVIEQSNHNPLLGKYEGVDGLKTGYVDNHYNYIGTAKRDGVRLVVVTLKSPSASARESDAKKLLDYGFSQYKKYTFNDANTTLDKLAVYKSSDVKETEVVIKDKLEIVLHSKYEEGLREEIDIPDYLLGGQKKGDVVGEKNIYSGDELLAQADIVLTEDLPKANFLGRVFDSIAISFNWIVDKIF